MTMQVLGQNGLSVDVNDGVHYLYKEDATKKGAGVTVNIGRDADVVPNVAGEILQVVPLKYGRILVLREPQSAFGYPSHTGHDSKRLVFAW